MLRISNHLCAQRIFQGFLDGHIAAYLGKFDMPAAYSDWLRYPAGSGGVLLAFLAGTELIVKA